MSIQEPHNKEEDRERRRRRREKTRGKRGKRKEKRGEVLTREFIFAVFVHHAFALFDSERRGDAQTGPHAETFVEIQLVSVGSAAGRRTSALRERMNKTNRKEEQNK
jgi:hypothetical protein